MPESIGAGSMRSPTVARNGFKLLGELCPVTFVLVFALEDLDGLARADGPLDADRRRLAEVDADAVVGRQRRLDDLLLHLAVERHRDLVAGVVLSDDDEGVLLGELREGDAERPLVVRIAGNDDRLERRRREMVHRGRSRRVDRVADLDLAETPEPSDLSGGGGRTLYG